MEINPEFEQAYDLIENTGVNIFLTGKAGTGKTTFLRSLASRSAKTMVIVAPTGVAALNAGGVTIHSFFQLSLGPYTPFSASGRDRKREFSLRKEKVRIIKSLQLLVIDEISMVRSDVLDAVSDTLCRYRRSQAPFGGVQLLMIGDMQQLSPVVKEGEKEILSRFYKSPYFFDSLALKKSFFTVIELTKIYRQSDKHFTDILNSVRSGVVDRAMLASINERFIPDFDPPSESGYITLTTHNNTMQSINDRKLKALAGEEYVYQAAVGDDFPEMIYPTEYKLRLKVGAQVMFVRNDSSAERRFYNGKLGVVTRLTSDTIEVVCKGETEPINVDRERWENIRYTVDEESQQVTSTVAGYFIQFPLRTAWAITIHKSQGLTFDKAIIDASGAFAHGQVYVALSRCRTLQGLVLSSPIRPASFINSPEVASFNADMAERHPEPTMVAELKKRFYTDSVCEMFDFKAIRQSLLTVTRLFDTSLARVYPSHRDNADKLSRELEDSLFVVTEKFKVQLQNMIATSENYACDPLIAQRILRGTTYMLPLVERLLEASDEWSNLVVDNNELNKVFKNNVESLFFGSRAKKIYMLRLGGSFTVETWLRCKSKVELGTGAQSEKRQSKKSNAVNVAYLKEVAPLYAKLETWKNAKARDMGVTPSKIASQKVILEICEKLPRSRSELSKISGVGKKFMECNGLEVLEMVLDFVFKRDISAPKEEYTESERKIREKKGIRIESALHFEMSPSKRDKDTETTGATDAADSTDTTNVTDLTDTTDTADITDTIKSTDTASSTDSTIETIEGIEGIETIETTTAYATSTETSTETSAEASAETSVLTSTTEVHHSDASTTTAASTASTEHVRTSSADNVVIDTSAIDDLGFDEPETGYYYGNHTKDNTSHIDNSDARGYGYNVIDGANDSNDRKSDNGDNDVNLGEFTATELNIMEAEKMLRELSFEAEEPQEVKKRGRKKKEKTEESEPAVPKKRSEEISIEMFKSGKTIKEIAQERNLVEGTIAGHFIKGIASGELDVYSLLDKPIVDEIMSALNTVEFQSLTEIYEHFNERYSFNEIKYVTTYRRRLSEIDDTQKQSAEGE